MVSLEKFVASYVSNAFEIMDNHPNKDTPLDIDSFYERVIAKVSSEVGLSGDEIRHIANPFHWRFFCGNNGSPLELIQDSKPGEKSKLYVRKIRAYDLGEREEIAKGLLEEHGEYFRARAGKDVFS